MIGSMAVIVTSACMSLSGNVQDACSKSIEAGAKQSGIEQNVETMQHNVEKIANRNAKYLFGDDGVKFIGGGMFIAKTVVDKSVLINIPTFHLADKATTQVGKDQYLLKIEWGF